MIPEECRRVLERAEQEWKRCRDELEAALKLVDEYTELELSVRELRQEKQALKVELEQLKEENMRLAGFYRKVEHPDFWMESVAYPLAKRLREWQRALSLHEAEGIPSHEAWARRVLELVQATPPGRIARREIEALLLALWHWLRMQEVKASFEE